MLSLQVCRSASLQVCKSASLQVCKSAGLRVCKSASLQSAFVAHRKMDSPANDILIKLFFNIRIIQGSLLHKPDQLPQATLPR